MGDDVNKTIGIIGIIICLAVQGFSANDSQFHIITTVLLFVFLMVYNLEHAKKYSKKSLVILGVSYIALILGVYQLLSFTKHYFKNADFSAGLTILYEISIIIVSVYTAVNIMWFIAHRLRKSSDGKES